MGAGAIPVVLTFLLVFVAWRMVFYFNKDLVRIRAWGELARRSLPFATLTLMALSLPLVQGFQQEWGPLAWALVFGAALLISNFLSMPLDERRANRAFRNGDYATAADLYRKLVAERPLARYWTFLGAALGASEQPEEAINASTKAVELDPEYGLAYYNRALILSNTGRKSRAAKDLRKALDVDLPRRFRTAANKMLEEL
ncbi:MAG: tetratricopeptide repeat protein [Actinomycetota bacterium]|nr:tetratricopeptide repeat protein [Actinomycetota bacterium]